MATADEVKYYAVKLTNYDIDGDGKADTFTIILKQKGRDSAEIEDYSAVLSRTNKTASKKVLEREFGVKAREFGFMEFKADWKIGGEFDGHSETNNLQFVAFSYGGKDIVAVDRYSFINSDTPSAKEIVRQAKSSANYDPEFNTQTIYDGKGQKAGNIKVVGGSGKTLGDNTVYLTVDALDVPKKEVSKP